MAEQKTKSLARHINQVKQLDPSVTLSNYYQEIKPFLFGTTSTNPISATNLPDGGIYSIAKSGVMSPSDDKVIVKIAGRATAEFKIVNVRNQEFIVDIQSKKRPASEYLFPSDLVRILTGLSRLFQAGNSTATGTSFVYNKDGLQKYGTDSDDLRWVKKWGEVNVDPKLLRIDSGLFYEKQFEAKYGQDVAELLNQVIKAAIEFENIFKPIDTTDFIPRSELEEKHAIPHLKDFILNEFEVYQKKVVPQINSDKKFEEAAKKIAEKIVELLKSDQTEVFRPLWTAKNEREFAKNEISNLEQNTHLWTTRSSDNKDGILQTKIFEEFVEEAVKKFLSHHGTDIENNIIKPLLESDTKETPSGATDSEEDSDEESAEPGQEEETTQELQNPISLQEFQTQLFSNLVSETYQRFLTEYIERDLRQRSEQDEYQQFIDNQYNFENNYLDPVLEDIRVNVVENWMSSFELNEQTQILLESQNLYRDNQVSQSIFDSDWYQELKASYLNTLPELAPPQGNASSYFEYLFITLVAPPIQLLSETTPEQQEAEEAPTTVDADLPEASGATVPQSIPSLDAIPSDQIKTETIDVSRLTPEQIRSLQYESAWMYNRAVYELFTAHGISEDQVRDLNPQLLQELQAGIFSYTAGLDQDSLAKLFASSTQRQKSLIEFYKAFYQRNNALLNSFYSDLPSSSAWNTLTPNQKQALTTRTRDVFISNQILSPEKILSAALSEATNLENTVLYQNIKNTVDTWVQQYGLNEPYFAFDPDAQTITRFEGENKHDVAWFISNLSADRLELILGLPEGLLAANLEFEKQFKQILLQYAKYSFSEQSLHIKNTTLQNGLILVSEEDARAIERGDEAIIKKHLAFTSGLRETNKEHGSETVAGALDHKKDSSRKDVLKHQYKTFLPLWNQLSGLEQAEIYKKYGLENYIPKNIDLEIEHLEFRPELVGFDITDLNKIRQIIENKKLSKAEREKLLELIAIQDQLQKEEALSEFFIESQDYYSEPEEIEVITELAGVESSYRERFYTEQVAYAEAGEDYGFDHPIAANLPSRRNPGLAKRITNSKLARKLKKRLKKKIDPLKKARAGFTKAASKAINKGAAASLNAIPVVGTGLSAALMAIPNKKVRNAISTIIMTGVTALVASTAYALGSFGGIIGAIIGYGLGWLAPGPLAIPGAIVGAHVGNYILPARWTGMVFGGGASTVTITGTGTIASTTAGTAASSSAAAGTAAAAEGLSLTAITSASIGILAPVGAIAAMIFTSLYTVLMIQSAFLIPVPMDRLDVGFTEFGPGVGNLGIDDCESPGPLPFANSATAPLAQAAYDIVTELMPGFWCYWNWHPQYDGLTANFQSIDSSEQDLFDETLFYQYPNHCIYQPNNPPGCGGDYRNMQQPNQLFWCTWLVNKTYQENYSLGAYVMSTQFQSWPGHIYLPAESTNWNEVRPGDVAFVSTSGPTGTVGHVAIVYAVEQDFITTLDSNAYSRFNQYTVGGDGKVQPTPYLAIRGFGRRL